MLAIAQLLRLPNVFTAFADIALAACAAGYLANDTATFALLLLTSGCLYCGGMAWNDIFDSKHDARTRPNRPLPSGRVTLRTAIGIALTLTLAGLGFAALANSLLIAGILAACILLYDAWLKHTPLGPVAMGLCRFLNIYLGLSGNPDALPLEGSFPLAFIVGLYIVGVTWFAHTEEGASSKLHLTLAASVMLLAAAFATSLLEFIPNATKPWYYAYLLTAWGGWIALAIGEAIESPGPMEVRSAVKRCIFGLIVLDAVLASAFVGWPGLLLVFLLLPARWLGQWVYST